MSDEKQWSFTCPVCGSEKEPAWCNGRLRSNKDGPFRSFAYCEDCDSEIPVPNDNFFSHITGYKYWWVALSLRAQLAEKDKEIERLSNPGRTQFCRMCQDYAEQIERLKAEQAKYQGEK